MDANGLRFWMLSEGRHWYRPGDPPALDFDRGQRCLRLASQRLPAWGNDSLDATVLEGQARSCLEKVPQARDHYGTRAYWDPSSQRIRATGALEDAVDLQVLASGESPSDLVMGTDGVLYVALAGQLLLRDCRGRWPDVSLRWPDFTAWRLAAHPEGGVWVLDRVHETIWQMQGLPLAGLSTAESDPNRLCACELNANPPRVTRLDQALIPAEETAVAIAPSPDGRLTLLSWRDGEGRVRLLQANGGLSPALSLRGSRFPYSFAWVRTDRLAILMVQVPNEAPVYQLPLADEIPATGLSLQPVGDLYPLQNTQEPLPNDSPFVPGPFVHNPNLPPHYPQQRANASDPPPTAALDAIPLPAYAREGNAIGRSALEAADSQTLGPPTLPTWDSGTPETVWHRIYLEAVIPANGGIQVFLAATDNLNQPEFPQGWHEHRFGERFLPGQGQVPCGAWLPMPSEVAFHPGVLNCPAQQNRSGLFTVLIQRSGLKVRSLQGRYLWVRVQLSGDGHSTPELAALRIYAARFSYRDRYLPELYHESVFGAERDERSDRSTPADFLERFLGNCEGILTPLEDRIANTYLLTDPRTTRPEALDWLGSWIGVTFDPAYPPERRRQFLARTAELYRRRGTLAGLELALDLATGGSVTGGEIVVLEDFRLRKTLATILGADLADEEDPLLVGLAVSGNSFVGDTLILGNETQKEFLALFSADLAVNTREAEAIAAFFDPLAYRATIYVHDQVEPQDLGLIRRVVDLETPAHVETRVVTASYPLLVGVASLIGIDTYLAPQPPPQSVRVDNSYLGRDFVLSPASLDPRLGRGRTSVPAIEPPLAQLTGPESVELGRSFLLDASQSRASPGRSLVRYRWQRIE